MLNSLYTLLILVSQDPLTADQPFLANNLVDQFISELTVSLVSLHRDTYKLSNLTIPIKNEQLGSFTINSNITATDVEIFNITHIERNGDAYINTANQTDIRLNVSLHVEPITATFTDIKFDLGFLSMNGPMRLESEGMDVTLQVSFNNSTCRVWFDQATLTNLDYEKIVILPDNFWNKMKDAAADLYINANHKDLEKITNSLLTNMMNSLVANDVTPCQLIPDFRG